MLATYNQQELHNTGRRVRQDALSDHIGYQDIGCELSPSCLRCPLERCRYDRHAGALRLRLSARNETLLRLHNEGASINALAAKYGLAPHRLPRPRRVWRRRVGRRSPGALSKAVGPPKTARLLLNLIGREKVKKVRTIKGPC